jgi:hypothetical protein
MNPPLEYLTVCVGTLIVFFFSRSSINAMGQVFMRLFRSSSMTVKALAFFLLPGTFIHEIAHFLFAEFLFVRTDDLNIIPQIREDHTIKLGGVRIEQTDPIRRTIIGVAPVILGLIILWVVKYFSLKYATNIYFFVFYLFVLFQITHTMFSSKKDLEGALIGFVFIALLVFIIKYLSGFIVLLPLIAAKERVLLFLGTNIVYLRQAIVEGVILNLGVWLISKFISRAVNH